MLEAFFWFLLFILIYTYFGYLFCLVVISLIYKKKPVRNNVEPEISILISAYNEEKYISKTINNKLELDYPKDKLEIIVISDGSTDKTDEIVGQIDSGNLVFLRQSERQGKTAALNRAVKTARGEIIVFSDANSIFRRDALKMLARNFTDTEVGYVTGTMMYMNPDGSVIGEGCNAYMTYENILRSYESDINSVVGVDGGIDAVRKGLYSPMNYDQLPDFVLPLSVVEKGYRVIYEPDAVLYEESLNDQASEFRMRTRVALRALWGIYDKRSLLNPLKYPLFSWQLFSHKVLRYMAWLPMIFILFVNLILAGNSITYLIFAVLQVLFYFFSFAGYLNKSGKGPVYITLPYYFTLINIASCYAFIKFVLGRKQVIWTPRIG